MLLSILFVFMMLSRIISFTSLIPKHRIRFLLFSSGRGSVAVTQSQEKPSKPQGIVDLNPPKGKYLLYIYI